MTDAEREAKLPQWAQAELKRLRRDRDTAQAAAANALGTTPSAIEISPHRRYDDKSARRFVPNDTPIDISLEGGRISIRLADNQLEIIGFSDGHDDAGDMGVFPAGGNTIHLRFAV